MSLVALEQKFVDETSKEEKYLTFVPTPLNYINISDVLSHSPLTINHAANVTLKCPVAMFPESIVIFSSSRSHPTIPEYDPQLSDKG